MDFEKIAREKIKVGLISVETLAEWLEEAYIMGIAEADVDFKQGWHVGYEEGLNHKDFR